MTHQIYPCLWFDNKAKAAAEFYCTVFKDSKITVDTPMVVHFQVNGKTIMGLNGGPQFNINPSISFFIYCTSVAETDETWNKLIAGGKAMMDIGDYPWSERYGWLQDKFGVTWQVMLATEPSAKQELIPSFLFTGKQFGKAEEAMQHYTNLFEHSAITRISKYPEGDPSVGKIMYAEFNLNKYPLIAMDGPGEHAFTFNEGVSFVITCDTQKEIDYYWENLTLGGEESMCGWLKDKFGISWQVVPSVLAELMSDPERAPRVVQAFLKMKKFNISALEKA